ncbi:hypothetical protein [Oceanobacillus jeddahense]|uniref:hypothetical protein n=1 Tax=Oceanobacillus jeddahense TaxID=1462527 RepID=UPI000595BD45|nr:hypothetical protein [Oceanobacillus jeddahense]
MKWMQAFMLVTILSFLVFPASGMATSLENLPSSEASDQWEVNIDTPKNNDFETKPDIYNIFSMDIKYTGDKDIKLDRVEAYRDDPSSSYDFELFTVNDDLEFEKNKEQPVFSHQNFPLSIQSTELKVIVTWSDKDDSSRKYKEEFIFKQ